MSVRACLRAIASYLPEGRLTNEMIVDRYGGEWTAEKVFEKTGIRSRRVASEGEFCSHMAVKAAKALFAQDPSFGSDIDLLVLATVTPDYLVPLTAALIHDELGLSRSAPSFDVTHGCAGYVYGLDIVSAFIESGRAKKALLLTSDTFTHCTEHSEQSARTIFGDGASASLIEARDPGAPLEQGAWIQAAENCVDGSGAKHLKVATGGARGWVGSETSPTGQPALVMDGAEVFSFTMKVVAPHIREFLASRSLEVSDISLFVFHQANLFMMEHLRKRLRIQDEQFVVRIEDVGNTISTSIPLALETALREGRVQPGAKVLLTGFGVGFAWGSVLLEYAG